MMFKVTGRVRHAGAVIEKPLPKPGQLAINAAKAAVRNVGGLLANGHVFSKEEVTEKRREICKGCEFYRASDDRCAHPKCGCYLRFKTALVAEKCPAAKW